MNKRKPPVATSPFKNTLLYERTQHLHIRKGFSRDPTLRRKGATSHFKGLPFPETFIITNNRVFRWKILQILGMQAQERSCTQRQSLVPRGNSRAFSWLSGTWTTGNNSKARGQLQFFSLTSSTVRAKTPYTSSNACIEPISFHSALFKKQQEII